MNTLIITSKKMIPPTDGGQFGSLGLIRYLHEIGQSVTLVSFYEGKDYNIAEKEELKKYVCHIRTVKLIWKNTALNFSLKYPNNVRKYTRRTMYRQLKQLKKDHEYNLVIIDHLQLYEYAKLFPESKIILHTHNVESNIWNGYAKNCKGVTQLFVRRAARMTLEYERNALITADGVTACSDTDLSMFKKMAPACNAEVMLPYIKCDRIKKIADMGETKPQILYIGNYDWYPNQSAALFLADELMPQLRKLVPGIKLFLVGKNPTVNMKHNAEIYSDIIVTGKVESVDTYIKDADVFVNAVTQGSGINIKMIEAMGKGIPIVTTSFGARGLGVVHGKEVLIYKTALECAEHIQSLISNKDTAVTMANHARAHYEHTIVPSQKIRTLFSTDTKSDI